MKTKQILPIVFFLGGVLSCQKIEEPSPIQTVSDIDPSVKNYITTTDNRVPAGRTQEVLAYYYNDLDLRTTYDMTINYNGSPRQIKLFHHPYFFKGYIDQATRFDVKPEDGWELIYNWLPTNTTDQVQFPALLMYNKYRGNMKLFYYHLSNLSTAGNVIGVLSSIGAPTKIFNFNQSIPSISTTAYSNVVTQSTGGMFTEGGTGLVEGNWYAFEWDVSHYDPSVGPGSYLSVRGWGQDLSTVNLSGTIGGDISGKLTNTVSSTDLNSLTSTSDIEKNIIGGAKSLLVNTAGKKIGTLLNNAASKSKNSLVKNVLTKAGSNETITSLAEAVAGPIGGLLAKPVSALLGKIFPGKTSSSTTETQVNLKVDLNAKISGTIERTPPFGRVEFQLPTKKINDWSYFGKIGLFSLKKVPDVAVVEDYVQISNLGKNSQYLSPSDFRYTYFAWFLDKKDELVVVNPDLLQTANVESSISLVYYNSLTSLMVQQTLPAQVGGKCNILPVLNENVDASSACVQFTGGLHTSYPEPYFDYVNDGNYFGNINEGGADYFMLTYYPAAINILGDYGYTYEFQRRLSSSTALNGMINSSGYKFIKILVTVKITPKNGSQPVLINQLFTPNFVPSQKYKLDVDLY